MRRRHPHNYGNAAVLTAIGIVMVCWAALIIGSAPPLMQAFLADCARFLLGAVVILIVAGLTCWGALVALGAVVGERDGEGV